VFWRKIFGLAGQLDGSVFSLYVPDDWPLVLVTCLVYCKLVMQ